MDRAVRDARRAEIESDLWESHEDLRRRGYPPSLIALHMLARLVLGALADLGWRAEHARFAHRIVQDALWAAAVASIVFVWWLASTLQALEPPERLRTGGIDVMRLIYPFPAIANVPHLPPPPREFARLSTKALIVRVPPPHEFMRLSAKELIVRLPPPPPPPPPKPDSR
jgi:hypothetical protein